MAKSKSSKSPKNSQKKSPKCGKKSCTKVMKVGCDGGVCPIKEKTKNVATQNIEPIAPKVSLCSKIAAALFFWKK